MMSAAAVAADGQPALAITDHGNMYGVLDFYAACKEGGIKPILGIELYMAKDSVDERPRVRRKQMKRSKVESAKSFTIT